MPFHARAYHLVIFIMFIMFRARYPSWRVFAARPRVFFTVPGRTFLTFFALPLVDVFCLDGFDAGDHDLRTLTIR